MGEKLGSGWSRLRPTASCPSREFSGVELLFGIRSYKA